MKQPRRLSFLVLFSLAALLLAACTGSVGLRGWSGPAKAGTTLIVATSSHRLDGFDSSGRRIWRFPDFWCVPDNKSDNLDGVYGKPQVAADGSVVFVGDYNGHVYAFRPGDVKPEINCDQAEIPAAPAVKLGDPVIGGLLLDEASGRLFATAGRHVYKINSRSMVEAIDGRGSIQHESFYDAGDDIWSTPVLAGGKVLFSSLDGSLYAVDAASNQLAWRFNAGKGLVSTAVLSGDRVLVAGFGSTLYAVDLDDGNEVWSFKANHWIWGAPAVVQGTAYFGDFDGVVHAVEVSDGGEEWSLALDKGAIRASPAVVAGKLIVSTDDGWLFGIDVASREVAWQRDIGSALNADITVDGSNVYIAPKGCVTPEGGGEKVYYIQVNPANGDLTAASGIC